MARRERKSDSNYVRWLCYRSTGFNVGSDKEFVWVPTPEDDERVYVQNELVSKNEKEFVSKDEKGETKKWAMNEKNFLGVNPKKFDGVEDMAELGHLNEPAVLYNMKKRYDVELFHTYSGLFLVIVNPYKRLPIYTDEMIGIYTGRRRDQIAPHVFALADTAYRAMLQDRQNQSMLITGESGAGKTENTKKVIQYLASIAGRAQEGGTLEQQLLEFNPVLEAFGNAKTNKNNNSSRFGKFIELQFNAGGQIAGANTLIYLLEKSRVVYQAENERNYHVFYQLIAGSTPEEKAQLHLTTPADYEFLNRSGCFTVKYMDDQKEFEHCVRAFDILNVTEEERWGIWEVVSAILHLGNLPIEEKGSAAADFRNDTALSNAAELLGVAIDDLREGLLRPKIQVGGRGDAVVKGLNAQKVKASRDALCKALYGRLFAWIVNKINEVLSHPEKKSLFIGVLDISGFEIFKKNSFEQLCINYTNEKLQQFFNHHMFTLEQKEYEAEGIEWNFIDFGMDSQDTIDLIEKPPNGILTILDEQTNFPDATDTTFTRRLHRTNGAHRSFRKPRFEANTFKIIHYAGDVEYDTAEWLEKNRDPIETDLVRVMKTSTHSLMQALWTEGLLPKVGRVDSKGPSAAARKGGLTGKGDKSSMWITVGLQYKTQLDHLMKTLRSTNPHFIRCIIPNLQQRPGLINNRLVLEQLRCNGVLEGIRITRKGFPNRVKYPQFLKRYHLLKPGLKSVAPNAVHAVKELMEYLYKNSKEVKEDLVRYGHTKIFFRTGQLPAIERLREKLISKMIISIQAAVRGYLSRRLYDKLREQTVAARVLQRNLRAWMDLKDWGWWRLFVKGKPILEDIDTQAVIDELKAKVKELEQKVADLESNNQTLSSTVKKLSDEILALKTRNEELEDQLENAESEKTNLDREVRILTKKAEGLQEELDDEVANNKMLNAEKNTLNGTILDLKNDVTDLEEDIKGLNADKIKLQGEIDEWEDKYDELEGLHTDLKTKLSEKESEIMSLEEKEFDSKSVSELLKNKLKSLENENKELQTQLDDKSASAREFEGKSKRYEGELKLANEQLETLGKEKDSLTDKLRTTTAKLSQVDGELATEKKRAEQLDKQHKSLKAKMRDIQDDVEQTREKQSSAERQKAALVDKYEEAQDELSASRSEVLMLKKRLDDNENEISDITFKLEDAENDAARWKKEAESRSQDINELTDELEAEKTAAQKNKERYLQANAQVEDLQMQLELRGGRGGASSSDLQQLKEELDRVRKELGDARDAKAAAERSLSAVSSERDGYKTQFEQSDAKATKYLRDLRTVSSQYEEANAKLVSAVSARDLLQKTNNEYNEEILSLKNSLVEEQIKRGVTLDLNQLQKENTKLKDEVESIKRNKRIQDIEIMDLKPQIDDLKYQLEQEKAMNIKLTAAIKEKEKMLLEREMANHGLITSLTTGAAQEKGELLSTIEELKAKNEELNQKCTQLNDDFEEMLTRLSRNRKKGGED